MEVTALLQTPVFLPQGKGPTVPSTGLDRFQVQCEPSGENINCLPLLADLSIIQPLT